MSKPPPPMGRARGGVVGRGELGRGRALFRGTPPRGGGGGAGPPFPAVPPRNPKPPPPPHPKPSSATTEIAPPPPPQQQQHPPPPSPQQHPPPPGPPTPSSASPTNSQTTSSSPSPLPSKTTRPPFGLTSSIPRGKTAKTSKSYENQAKSSPFLARLNQPLIWEWPVIPPTCSSRIPLSSLSYNQTPNTLNCVNSLHILSLFNPPNLPAGRITTPFDQMKHICSWPESGQTLLDPRIWHCCFWEVGGGSNKASPKNLIPPDSFFWFSFEGLGGEVQWGYCFRTEPLSKCLAIDSVPSNCAAPRAYLIISSWFSPHIFHRMLKALASRDRASHQYMASAGILPAITYQARHIHVSDLVLELQKCPIPVLAESVVLDVPSRWDGASGKNLESDNEVFAPLRQKSYTFGQELLGMATSESEPHIRAFILALKPSHLFSVLCHILCEHRVIFVSSDVSLLFHAFSAIPLFLYPFSCCSIFINVLPSTMLDVCSSLSPFVVGIRKNCVSDIYRMPLETHVWVDLDTDLVEVREGEMNDDDYKSDDLVNRQLKEDILEVLIATREAAKKEKTLSRPLREKLTSSMYLFYNRLIPNLLSFIKIEDKGGQIFPFESYVEQCSIMIRPFLLKFLTTRLFLYYIQSWIDLCKDLLKRGSSLVEAEQISLRFMYDLSSVARMLSGKTAEEDYRKNSASINVYGLIQENFPALKNSIFLEKGDPVVVLEEVGDMVGVKSQEGTGLIPIQFVRVISKDVTSTKFQWLDRTTDREHTFPYNLLKSQMCKVSYPDLLPSIHPPFVLIHFDPHPLLEWLPVVVSKKKRQIPVYRNTTVASIRQRVCIGLCKLLPPMRPEASDYYGLMLEAFGLKDPRTGEFLADNLVLNGTHEVSFTYLPPNTPNETPERQQCLMNMVESECLYLASLFAMSLYKKGLSMILEGEVKASPLSTSDLPKLFSNLESLLVVHLQFQTQLRNCMKTWVSNRSTVGDAFTKHFSVLLIYLEWVIPNKEGLEIYASHIKGKEELDLSIPLDPLSDLSKLLPVPCGRLNGYISILEHFSSLTPSSHPDHALIASAQTTLRGLCDKITHSLNQKERASELLQTQHKGMLDVVEAGRHLVGSYSSLVARSPEGQMHFSPPKEKETTLCLYIFNNIFCFVNEQQANKGKHVTRVLLDLVWFPETTSSNLHDSPGFSATGGTQAANANLVEIVVPSMRLTISGLGDKDRSHLLKYLKETVLKHLGNPDPSRYQIRSGRWVYGNGGVYEGEWNFGSPSGKGVFQFMGNVYEGDWEEGRLQGEGKCRFFDGSVLEGVFMNNYPEQKCSLSYLNGDHFDGLFVKGKRNGKGIWVCRGGFLKFDGFFVNDRMSGDFMISYINPSETRFGEITYQGQVSCDTMHGQGTLTLDKNKIYQGGFDSNLRHGEGTLTYPNWSYKGFWKFGLFDGNGFLKQSSGGEFSGMFESGLYHGKGTFNRLDKSVYVGKWNSGYRQGDGREVYANGDVYDGDWKRDRRHGKGVLTNAEGVEIYRGYWKRGLYHGKGVMKIRSRDGGMVKLDGNWKNGVLDGDVTLSYEPGKTIWEFEKVRESSGLAAVPGKKLTKFISAGKKAIAKKTNFAPQSPTTTKGPPPRAPSGQNSLGPERGTSGRPAQKKIVSLKSAPNKNSLIDAKPRPAPPAPPLTPTSSSSSSSSSSTPEPLPNRELSDLQIFGSMMTVKAGGTVTCKNGKVGAGTHEWMSLLAPPKHPKFYATLGW